MGWKSKTDMAEPVTLAVLDDHALLVDSIVSWFAENAPDFAVVSNSTTWAACMADESFPPQLVLMDYHLSEPVSIEARILTCRAAGAKIIVMSAFGGPEIHKRIIEAGADGFFEKTVAMESIAHHARKIFGLADAGCEPVNQSVPVAQTSDFVVGRPQLSSGERDALLQYAQGKSTKEVAESMNVQYETAKTFLRRVREKYARAGRPASRRADLVRRAAEDGYLT